MQPLTDLFRASYARSRIPVSVTDASGNVVTVNPAPVEAWVIEFTAPPQGIWASISALQEVERSNGVAVGGGLWAVPTARL